MERKEYQYQLGIEIQKAIETFCKKYHYRYIDALILFGKIAKNFVNFEEEMENEIKHVCN